MLTRTTCCSPGSPELERALSLTHTRLISLHGAKTYSACRMGEDEAHLDTDRDVREDSHVHLCSFYGLEFSLQRIVRRLQLLRRYPHTISLHPDSPLSIRKSSALRCAASGYRENTLVPLQELDGAWRELRTIAREDERRAK